MPDGASRALPLLERALALEPDYATALAYAAWCHEVLFVRAGLREENRLFDEPLRPCRPASRA